MHNSKTEDLFTSNTLIRKENYKLITEKDSSKIDYSKIPPIMGYVINSAITYPVDKQTIEISKDQKTLTIKGWALGSVSTGTPIKMVELSFDDGKTW